METGQNAEDITDDSISPGRDLKDYVESRIELFSLTIAEQIASAISASIQKFVGMLFLAVGAIFLWIALGFFLGELFNSQALGFFVAALPLVLVGLILYNRTLNTLEDKIQIDIIKKISIDLENQRSAEMDIKVRKNEK